MTRSATPFPDVLSVPVHAEPLPDRLRTLAVLLTHVFGGARLTQAIDDLWDAAQTLDAIAGNPQTRRKKPKV